MPKKISQLESATDVTASDLIQIVDIEDTGMATTGTNKKCTAQLMANELGKLTNITAAGSTTPRALANRFADVANVKDFGAVGDGVTDDRSAIQLAIDFANTNKISNVLFENRTYALGSRLYWKSNVLLIGGGETILKLAPNIDSPIISIINQQDTSHITNIGAIGVIFDGNYSQSPRVNVYSAVILDPVDGAYFERCKFSNASGYGASLQYLATGVPDNNRVKNITFVQCDFNNNGWGPAIPGTQYDGIDIKNGYNLKFIACRAFDNAEKGFNPRGENIDFISCEAHNNGSHGIEVNANANGTTQNTSVKIIGGSYHDNDVHGISVVNNTSGGSGYTLVDISGVDVINNTSNGINFNSSNSNTYATINAKILYNGSDGVSVSSAKQVVLNSCQIVQNDGDGIYCNASFCLQVNGGIVESNGGWGYIDGTLATRNSIDGGTKILGNVIGNISAAKETKVDASVLDYTPNSGSFPSDIIESSSTITLPAGGSVFFIAGTTTIQTITPNQRGRVVTLIFSGALTVSDGAGNLLLNGNFTTSSADSLTIAFDGTNWCEISRSPN